MTVRSNAMRICTLTVADVGSYRKLMLEAYAQAPDAFTSTVQEREQEPHAWWIRRVADPNGLGVCFGAFDASRVMVGAVAIEYATKPKLKHLAVIIGMYVRDAARGCGLGSALLTAALKHAACQPGLKAVTLTVTEGNAPAMALYRAAGFQAWGTQPMAVATPSGFKGKVHMWRALEQPEGQA